MSAAETLPPGGGRDGVAARRGAVRILGHVLGQKRMLSEAAGAVDDLAPAERARAQTLAAGVLRHLHRLDAVLDGFLDRRPPGPVLGVLRVAAHEILIEGIADYAAVDAAVRQVQGGKAGRFKGLVNAVGRRLAKEGPDALAAAGPPELPGWLMKPVARAWGAETAAAIAQVHLTAAPLDLTPRDTREGAALAQALGAECLPTGSLRLTRAGQVTALEGFETGRWWVQDAAAAMPVQMLGDLQGLRVLDLCAAPGGKTLQLAARGAQVTALDLSPERLERVSENLRRTGLRAEIVAADALDWAPASKPDVIVLDAPCSATGTLRRHPDLIHVRPNPDLAPLLELQAALIDRAIGWLNPGGRLLYCTCSLIPREGEGQVSRALERHPGLSEGAAGVPGTDPDWWLPTGALRLRPDFWAERGGMDGFFATVLTKTAPEA